MGMSDRDPYAAIIMALDARVVEEMDRECLRPGSQVSYWYGLRSGLSEAMGIVRTLRDAEAEENDRG